MAKKELWRDVELPNGSYADASIPFTQQDLKNYYAEYAVAGSLATHKLMPCPGLRTRMIIDGAGTVRGARDVEGLEYVVVGETLIRIVDDTTIDTLGTIPGVDLVVMDHNQTASGNQLAISNGEDGWILDCTTDTLTQITDPGFPGWIWVGFLNQRFLGIEPERHYAFNSEEADGLSYDSLERYVAESAPDLLVGAITSHELWILGNTRTIEFFAPSSSPDDIANHILYRRIPGTTAEVGFAALHGAANLDNAVYFLGSDRNVHELRGYTTRVISPPAVVASWADYDISEAICYVHELDSHKFFYLTFPNGLTWGYDVLSSAIAGKPIWHRRESQDLTYWRVSCTWKHNGKWYAGSALDGHIYEIDPDFMLEGCDDHDRRWRSGVLYRAGNRMELNAFRLRYDATTEESQCEEIVPIELEEEEETPEILYVLNSGTGKIEHYDVPAFTSVDETTVAPAGNISVICTNPAKTLLFVSCPDLDCVAFVDIATNDFYDGIFDADMQSPLGLVCSPDGQSLYVTHVDVPSGSYAVSKYNIADPTIVEERYIYDPLTYLGRGEISINTAGSFVYPTTFLSQHLNKLSSTLSLADNRHFTDDPIDQEPVSSMYLRGLDSNDYVCTVPAAGTYAQVLYFLNPSTLDTEYSVTLTGAQGNGSMCHLPDRTKIYVCGNISENVSVVDASTFPPTLVETITLPSGSRPRRCCPSRDGTYVFVTDASLNQFYVIDTATDTLSDTIATGAGGNGVLCP